MQTEFSTKEFFYTSKDKTFSGEISELTQGGTRPLFCEIYDDACDEGLVLVSEKTGCEVKYAVVHEENNADGDLEYYELRPIRGSNPLASGTKIIIFND